MSDRTTRRDDIGEPQKEGAPADIGQETPQTRALVRALEHALRDFREDLVEVKTRAHTDFFRTLWVFGVGFVLLAGMVIEAYRWAADDLRLASTRLENRIDKVDDRVVTTGNTLTRVDQKLQDLLDRVPATPTRRP